jgi:hypothetical protein
MSMDMTVWFAALAASTLVAMVRLTYFGLKRGKLLEEIVLKLSVDEALVHVNFAPQWPPHQSSALY